jgi:talin
MYRFCWTTFFYCDCPPEDGHSSFLSDFVVSYLLRQASILACHPNVAGAASSQEQLAVAAQNAVSTIVQLAEVVKFGAASLGSNNPEAQVSWFHG